MDVTDEEMRALWVHIYKLEESLREICCARRLLQTTPRTPDKRNQVMSDRIDRPSDDIEEILTMLRRIIELLEGIDKMLMND